MGLKNGKIYLLINMAIALEVEGRVYEITIPTGQTYVVIARDYAGNALAVVTEDGYLLLAGSRKEFASNLLGSELDV